MFHHKKIIALPMTYWEEYSCMMGVLAKDDSFTIKDFISNLEGYEEIEVIEQTFSMEKRCFEAKIRYADEDYEINFFEGGFKFIPNFILPAYLFSKTDIDALDEADRAINVFMKFPRSNPKKAYHLQIKLLVNLIPSLLAVMDESAEKLMPKEWAKMSAASQVDNAPEDLYTVQMIADKKYGIWLHTHGLCRCGISELEILKSSETTYRGHYNLLINYANYLIDKDGYEYERVGSYIGLLNNRIPIVVTAIPWPEAIRAYKNLKIGNMEDRQNGHNTNSDVIFLYLSAEDEKNGNYTPVDAYDPNLDNNPLYFVSNEETKRMAALAQERFYLAKEYWQKDYKCQISVKIGVPIPGEDNYEHIWFDLIEFEGDKLKVVLNQEPYEIENLKVGDIAWFTVSDITDWLLYSEKYHINPDGAYKLLME